MFFTFLCANHFAQYSTAWFSQHVGPFAVSRSSDPLRVSKSDIIHDPSFNLISIISVLLRLSDINASGAYVGRRSLAIKYIRIELHCNKRLHMNEHDTERRQNKFHIRQKHPGKQSSLSLRILTLYSNDLP